MLRKILIGLVIVLIGIQFFRPEKNIHPGPQPAAISRSDVPDTVQVLLQKACYDCHSNNTRYPWYNRIQPVAWWLQHHVNEGKRELNFDEFQQYSNKKKTHKLKETAETVKEKEMPLNSYLWGHPEARLTESERALLTDWALSLKNKIPQ
ncbi:MAG: heme-binding domain-containing protein [Bacteroidota bacterium]|nr:heme-binding domain-containing protein [Flavisolibacter sp.]MBD0288714.1 heme-binding domain-containing protein [Flavisolibacter sp.]MBD0294967.1 heme-binding domain-containing protein [Flavisolibacter sp.]MBD0366081.1 heme-binding domain-containing protein [Flavisolibacter sp.]MDQ3844059.1 heme-binding domain-containing protein [Bacteroidota bacterium]